MKLKNKKTGEIVTADLIYSNADNCISSSYSLAELNEEWEDYEEPKKLRDFWFIDDEGGVEMGVIEFEENLNLMQEIGNYFETKEETKKAVEKLKAWKRLKDKGFEFVELRAPNYSGPDIITIKAHCPWNSKNIDDLALLFRR